MLVAIGAALPVVQAESDETLVRLWLHGRGLNTIRAYTADIEGFRAFVGTQPLATITLGQFQAYADSLTHLAPATRGRRLGTVKSLFAFAHRLGYVPFNTAAALRLPPVRQQLAARILSESETHRLLDGAETSRDKALLRLLYAAGLRISEAAALRWRDLVDRDDAGQVTVLGKGERVRSVLLSPATWAVLVALRGEAGPDAPVFRSGRTGDCLDASAVHRIVKAAAGRAGLSDKVSALWLRHCHVSHALDRNVPAHLVQATVGHASLATTSRYAHARPNDSSARYLGC